jgi:hypothetical protein
MYLNWKEILKFVQEYKNLKKKLMSLEKMNDNIMQKSKKQKLIQ